MRKKPNYITKKALRYGLMMHISFTLTFILLIGTVFIGGFFEEKTYWVIPLLLMLITGPLTYVLYNIIQIQNNYRNTLFLFIAENKPLKGKQYSLLLRVIGFESNTQYISQNNDKYVIRIWYAVGYTLNVIFDDNDTVVDYHEVNEFNR